MGDQTATFATNSGVKLMNAGDLTSAIAQFESAIKAAPDYAPAHQQLAVALRRTGETKRAEEELKIAAELSSKSTSR